MSYYTGQVSIWNRFGTSIIFQFPQLLQKHWRKLSLYLYKEIKKKKSNGFKSSNLGSQVKCPFRDIVHPLDFSKNRVVISRAGHATRSKPRPQS